MRLCHFSRSGPQCPRKTSHTPVHWYSSSESCHREPAPPALASSPPQAPHRRIIANRAADMSGRLRMSLSHSSKMWLSWGSWPMGTFLISFEQNHQIGHFWLRARSAASTNSRCSGVSAILARLCPACVMYSIPYARLREPCRRASSAMASGPRPPVPSFVLRP